MGAISAIYVLDSKGKQLIARDFRGDIAASCVERFVSLVTGARQRAQPTMRVS
jgi:AP-1 complex subunit mu